VRSKKLQGDGDSVSDCFISKGGDYRARESNVHRLAEVSANIIDQCVPQEFLWHVSMEVIGQSFFEVRLFLELLCKRQTGQQIARSLLSNEPSDRSWKNKNAPQITKCLILV
jgi:succinate dehydrogenase / fumarate reductase flavoprotein subunit